MKHPRLTAAFMAAAALFAPLSPLAPAVQNAPAVYAETIRSVNELPDWIPNDYESALEFRNTFGATHIDDGLICVVLKETIDKVPKGEPQGIKRYELKVTENMAKNLKDSVYGSEDSESCYEVVVYQPQNSGDFGVALIDTWVKSSSLEPELGYVHYCAYYTFNIDADGNITQTDSNGWMPDCITEYNDYVEKNGLISVRGKYLVFCLDSVAGTAYTWQLMLTGFGDYFDGYDLCDCSRETAVPLAGGAMHIIRVFEAKQDGYATVGYEYRDDLVGESDKKAEKSLIANCVILDNASTILLGDTARIRFRDAETNDLLSVPSASETLKLDPMIGYKTEKEGEYQYTEVELIANSNPFFWDCSAYRNADIFKLNPGMLPSGYALPQEYKKVEEYDNGALDITFYYEKIKPAPNEYQAEVSLMDYDTGKQIILNGDAEFALSEITNQFDAEDALIVPITANPCKLTMDFLPSQGMMLTMPRHYQRPVATDEKTGRKTSVNDYCTINLDKNGVYHVAYRLKFVPTGDISGDNRFKAEDIAVLENCLLCNPEAKPVNWKAVDYNNDDCLDARDLTLMKRAYIAKRQTPVAVSITQTGGYDGIHIEWNVFAEDGKYLLTYLDRKTKYDKNGKPIQPEMITTLITEEEYREIMAVDYDTIIEEYYAEPIMQAWDGFSHNTVLTFADGTKRETYADMGTVLMKLEKLMIEYNQ